MQPVQLTRPMVLGYEFQFPTEFFDNDSFVVIFTYVFKALLSMYFSSFQSVIKRVGFIVLDSPAYTFFPLVLLSIVTYVMAFSIYLLERTNDAEHFGSIVRAFWFSIVTMTTIGYGKKVFQSIIRSRPRIGKFTNIIANKKYLNEVKGKIKEYIASLAVSSWFSR